ncbi:MAG: substrate binding domain-containing protein, partial [Burkholderiales bacterium]
SALESHLGARLLRRTTRRLALTETGSAYFERCRQILSDVEEAESLAAEADAQPKGLLRISLPQSFGLRHVAPMIPDFCARYPALQLDISFSDRVIEFVEEGVDVAVRIALELKESLVARRLMMVPIVACAAESYLGRFGAPKIPADLKSHDCLQYSYASSQLLENIPVSGNFRTNSGDMIRLAALAGQGIAMLPLFLVADDLRSGKLRRVLEDHPFPGLGIYVVYLESARRSARIKAFIDYISEKFSGKAPWDQV